MTVARLRVENPLDPARRVKISRGEVYGVMARSVAMCCRENSLKLSQNRLRGEAMG